MGKIVVTEQLRFEHLAGLISGEFTAVRVPEFCDERACDQVNAFVAAVTPASYAHEIVQDGIVHYLDYGVMRIGKGFNSVADCADETERKKREQDYFGTARSNREEIRRAFGGQLQNPLDRFIGNSNAHHVWPRGIEIAKWHGREMFSGIIRITLPQAKLLAEAPHIDSLNAPFNTGAQLSANFYTSMPDEGGELIIYDHKPLGPEEAKAVEADESRRRILLESSPQLIIKPQKRDFILCNTRQFHAVKVYGSNQGARISQQTFIGIKDWNTPAVCWT